MDDHLQLVLDHNGRDAGGEEAGSVGTPPLPHELADLFDTPLEPAGEGVSDLGACLPDPVVDDHPDCLSGIGEAGMEVVEAARDGCPNH